MVSVLVNGIRLDESQISIIKSALSEYAKSIREDGEDGVLVSADRIALQRISHLMSLLRK